MSHHLESLCFEDRTSQFNIEEAFFRKFVLVKVKKKLLTLMMEYEKIPFLLLWKPINSTGASCVSHETIHLLPSIN